MTALFSAVLVCSLCAWPPAVEQWRSFITESAARYHLDDDLLAAVIWAESAGDPAAMRYEPYWDVTSYGLMQIVDWDFRRVTPEQLLDPAFNVDYGASILRQSIEQGGSLRVGLAAYNCSLEGVNAGRCGRFGGLHYADKTLALCRAWGGCIAPKKSRHFVY